MDLLIRKSHPKAVIPTFAHDDDACFDLTATSVKVVGSRSRIYGTRLHFDIPKGYHVEAYIRSSIAFKKQIILTNGVGIIDSGYTGEVMLHLTYVGEDHPDGS
jgi:dUTP pyrophosphatase